jgi:FlaA1/EpsC-like NDP-sugar epimerase
LRELKKSFTCKSKLERFPLFWYLVMIDAFKKIVRVLALENFRSVLYRRLIILVCQTLLIVATYYFSFLLRFDGMLDPQARAGLLHTIGALIVIKVVCFYVFGLMSGWWRYAGFSDVWDIGKAALTASALFAAFLRFVLPPMFFPRSVIAFDLVLTICALGGARFAVRAYRESVHRHSSSTAAFTRKGTLIVGAGQAGTAIVRELLNNPDLGYSPVGFVDDDLTKRGIKVHGVKVLGPASEMNRFVQHHHARCVLIAIPSATGRTIEQILEKCRESGVEVKILQPVSSRIDGSGLSLMRTIKVEDLLGREPVRLEVAKIEKQLQGRVILITGAGGSIGAEISRQVAWFRPARLLLLDRAESALFEICTELASSAPDVNCLPVIADILDVGLLRDIFVQYRPNVVFHAAAYKHVPMMEQNCFQAITNNVFGTYNVALVARQYDVETFVLISTDKAVNPANVMGVTKRIAEMIVLAMQSARKHFIAVRFGNVLGSNGSVVPIFRQQIERGGPVTVTHPDATRFLMTIPEAAQLVLQASTMAKPGGQIFMLKMGEPVRILNLAENMIRLSGLRPGRDIMVVFTGLRPGEKLIEELSRSDEGARSTSHDRIYVLESQTVSLEAIRRWLADVSALIESKNVDGLITKLKEMVPEYSPSADVVALCELNRHDIVWRYRRDSAALAAISQDIA